MTEDRRLSDKIARLASEEQHAGGARRISAGGDRLFHAILAEIDETILGRRLTFRRDDGGTLAVEVANRRLLRIVDAPTDAPKAGLFDPLGSETDDLLPAIAEIVKAFVLGQDHLLVDSVPLTTQGEPGVLGRSVAALARAAGTDLYADEAPQPVDDGTSGATELSHLAMAVRVFGASNTTATGPEAARLDGLDEDAVRGIIGKSIRPPRPGQFVLLSGGAAADALFLGLRTDSEVVAALIPAARLGEAVALWRGASSDA